MGGAASVCSINTSSKEGLTQVHLTKSSEECKFIHLIPLSVTTRVLQNYECVRLLGVAVGPPPPGAVVSHWHMHCVIVLK